MFKGTVCQSDNQRSVLIETQSLQRLDVSQLAREVFSLIILKSGSITVKIDQVDCYFEGPAVICLDERKQFEILSNGSIGVDLINFDPRFLNINMEISTIRSSDYECLCQQHVFFQLSPFVSEDINRIGFRLNSDTMEKIERSFFFLTRNLQEQKDWYWSCRARSYFIDIINILERIFHNYYIEEETVGTCLQASISKEFKSMLVYINNHLDDKLTLDSLYKKFRINKNQIENLFKEYLDTTFYTYLRNRRYEEAAYYLRFTELDGEQIAGRIGLSSSQNFCKFFRAVSGQSPNKFRKEMTSSRKKAMGSRTPTALSEVCNRSRKKISI